jgi:hypothetical protein
LSVGAPALKEKAPKDPPLVGRWIQDHQPDGLEYEFTPLGEWIISQGGKVIDGTARMYRLDKEAGAGAVDLTESPRPYPSLYRVADGVLTLCIRHDGKGRPTSVDETGPGILSLTFRRIKPNN